jgi:hypothetical protein
MISDSVNIPCYLTDRDALKLMAVDFGIPNTKALLRFLVKMHQDGLLVVMNKVAKECLVAAAEEKIVRMAKRAALEETNFVLYQKGFVADPYER